MIRTISLILLFLLVACTPDSPDSLAMPIAHESSAPVPDSPYTVLDEDLTQLTDRFNANHGRLRLVFIVGPTCGICLRGMADLNDAIVAGLQQDNRMETFVIHVPTLGAEERHVEPSIQLLSGPRIHHYWDESGHSGIEYQETLDIPAYAWDVWLIYGPDARWEPGDPPPKPDFWQHQLGGLPVGEKLDSEEFAREILARIESVDETALDQRTADIETVEHSLIPVAQPRGVMIQQNLMSRGSYSKLKTIKRVDMTGTMTIGVEAYPLTVTTQRPGQYHREISTPAGIAKAEVSDGAIMYFGDAVQPMLREIDTEVLAAFEFDGWLMDWKEKGHQVWRLGMNKDGDRLPWLVEVEHRNGQTWHVYIDSHNGDAYRRALINTEGEETIAVDFDDFREVNEFRLPHKVTYRNGQNVVAVAEYANIDISLLANSTAVIH